MTQQARMGLLAVAIVGGGFIILAGGVGVALLARGGGEKNAGQQAGGVVKAPSKADDWTYTELAEHLRSHGIRPLVVAASSANKNAAWFLTDPKYSDVSASGLDLLGIDDSRCLVTIADPGYIRDEIARHGNPPGMLGWGKFFFQSDARLIARIRAALT